MQDNRPDTQPNLFPLDPCADISWQGGWAGVTIQDIANNFNVARSHDETVTGPDMDISARYTQDEWDALTIQEKGLWLLNSERDARGIKKFSAIVPELVTISEDFATYLSTTGAIAHNVAIADWTASGRDAACDVDGNGEVSPYDRIKCDARLNANTQFWNFAENLGFTSANSADEMNEPIAWSIYSWIYDDSTSDWGHRHFCLASTVESNNAAGTPESAQNEGLLGFGVHQGTAGTFTVMMGADESPTWEHPDWDTLRTEDIPAPN